MAKMGKLPSKKEAAAAPVCTCISCKKAESPDLHGSMFTSNGENGMIITFWMCESCAIPLGPAQGAIDIDDPTTRV